MKPPIHLVMFRPDRPAPNDETALFRARGRELAHQRRRAELRRWLALVTRATPTASTATTAPAATPAPTRPGPAPARQA